MRTVAVINKSSFPIPATFIGAMNKYAALVSRVWGNGLQVVESKVTPVNGWAIQLKDVADVQGALGYHDVTGAKQPIGYIFCKTCADAKVSWSSCFAHELAEMMADPYCQWMSQDPQTGFIYPQEICDAVEGNLFLIDGIEVSNFLLQSWFSPAPAAKFDYLGVTKSPFEIAPSGYVSRIEGGNYKTVWGSRVPQAVKERAHSRLGMYERQLKPHLCK